MVSPRLARDKQAAVKQRQEGQGAVCILDMQQAWCKPAMQSMEMFTTCGGVGVGEERSHEQQERTDELVYIRRTHPMPREPDAASEARGLPHVQRQRQFAVMNHPEGGGGG